jgi:hypothetical protein
MITLLLLFAFQVVTPGEMACVGSIQEMKVPEDVYVAGVEGEGIATYVTPGRILFLNGPGVSFLKTGSVQKVVRPEGKVRDPLTQKELGTYFRDVGTVRIETVDQESATARVVMSCEGMLKGDLIISNSPKPIVEFNGTPSNPFTALPHGLSSSILFAKNDARNLAAGQFCFIQAGKRDGVKPGDRFIVFRPYPPFNQQDMANAETAADSTYSSIGSSFSGYRMDSILRERTIPPKILGDIVIVEVGEAISTGKIVNSMSEINPGDLVVRR